MRIAHALLVLTAVMATFTAGASAQNSKKLTVGDKAPALSVETYFNGEGPSNLDPAKIYVVEFWATWCGPCKRAIPHLNELHNRLSSKGVTIIGVSDEKADTVRPFVQSRGSGMSYLVAVDKNNATTKAWREAAGVDGIPCSFIVGHDNKIVYIGNPLEAEFERTLYAVASGRFDPIADKKGRPNIEAARRAATVRNFKDAALHYNNAIAIDPKTFAWAAQERYKMHLNQERNPLAAAVYAKQFMETYAGDAIGLGDFAVMIVSDTDIQERDIESAKAAAEKMIAVGGRNSPAVLERLAVVQFHTGQVQEAVDTQMEAWMLASAAEKAAFKLRLDAYRAAANRKGAAETRAGNR